jgi:hypothetical protein
MPSESADFDYETPTLDIPLDDVDWIGMQRTIGALHEHTPLQYFHWDLQVGETNVYDYEIRAVGNRRFTQVYTYDGSPEQPTISTGGDAWSLVEINLHRDVRAYVLRLVSRFGATKIHAKF